MRLTPEQRQAVVTSIFYVFNMYDAVSDPDGERITVDDVADAAINAILSLSSPPCAEVVPGASDGVPSVETCKWKYDGDGFWGTSCYKAHDFCAGGPNENEYKFCPFCGKPLEVIG